MSPAIRFFVVLAALFSSTLAFAPPMLFSLSSTSTGSSLQQRQPQRRALSVHRENVVMMPATIEKEAIRTGGPAVLDRPQTEETRRRGDTNKEEQRTGSEAWEVRIYNDVLNTREHVARSLVQVTGMSEVAAYQTMMQAHRNGIAAVGRWCFELAEMYHEQLRQNGIVCDIVPVDEES